MASAQVLSSAASVAIVYWLYLKGKQLIDRNGLTPPYLDGLDPNWPGGKPIGIDNPVDIHDSLPACEAWNEEIQLFVRTGNTQGEQTSQQSCFTNANPTDPRRLLRWADITGNVSFNVEDPLSANPDEAGTCYLLDSNKKLYNFPGYAPINRNARLCFNAGQTEAQSGQIFKNTKTNLVSYNPLLDEDSITALIASNPGFSWATPAGVDISKRVADPPAPATYCEFAQTYQGQGTVTDFPNVGYFWMHSTDSAPYDGDVDKCVANPLSRFMDPANNAIVYLNPNTKTKIQRNLTDNL